MPRGDSGSWSIELDRNPDAPRVARHALEAWLANLPEQVRYNALLVVGELVANAVRFSLVIEVSDEGRDRPRRRVPAEDRGIGLNVVYLLADRVEIEPDRSCVRCTLNATVAMSASRASRSDREPASVELVREASTLRVLLSGDIDLSTRPELDQVLAGLDPSQLDRLVVDLRGVTFFDSTGLQMAQLSDRWGRANNVTVVFTRSIPAVMLALRAAGLVHRLTFSDAPEDQPHS